MSNYRNYENPLILREMIIEQREHVAYLIKSGCRLEYIKDEIRELETLENRERKAWEDELQNGTL